ncbi:MULTISPECIES: polysaccharide deacetylase family protein [Streptomyces]|uniref:polysaccharide deacetylase family protein n=1 Tax=Streptomyces TaxID=1883 RepID=UPI000491166A|nr:MULTISPECIES: polysaccharide deacetylase family protein [Streptomyces]MYY18435.1 polysaccharide deacetylase family protein [Streptomyces sp. SID4912]
MNGRGTATGRRTILRAATGAALLAAGPAGCADAGRITHAPERPGPAGSPSGAGRAGGADRPAPAPGPRRFPGQPVQIDHGPRNRPQVALTFHGEGDPALAGRILADAERTGARITVLAVGTWLDAHPRMARRILDGGHDLGNHTQNHLDINALGEDQAYAEITGCAERLRRLTGSIGTWFRPSRSRYATPLVQDLARRAGYPHVLAHDVDSLDATATGVAAVTRKVAGELRDGAVVSLHLGRPDTVAALPLLLTEITRRGLRAVTATELLS